MNKEAEKKEERGRISDWNKPGSLAHAALTGEPLLSDEAWEALASRGIDPYEYEELIRTAIIQDGAILSEKEIKKKNSFHRGLLVHISENW